MTSLTYHHSEVVVPRGVGWVDPRLVWNPERESAYQTRRRDHHSRLEQCDREEQVQLRESRRRERTEILLPHSQPRWFGSGGSGRDVTGSTGGCEGTWNQSVSLGTVVPVILFPRVPTVPSRRSSHGPFDPRPEGLQRRDYGLLPSLSVSVPSSRDLFSLTEKTTRQTSWRSGRGDGGGRRRRRFQCKDLVTRTRSTLYSGNGSSLSNPVAFPLIVAPRPPVFLPSNPLSK